MKKFLIVCFLAFSTSAFAPGRRIHSSPGRFFTDFLGSRNNPYIFDIRFNAVLAAVHDPSIRGWCKALMGGPLFLLQNDMHGGLFIIEDRISHLVLP